MNESYIMTDPRLCITFKLIRISFQVPPSTTAVSPDGTTVTKTTTTTSAPDASAVLTPTLTQANLDRVSTDMSKAEVEAILGTPTSSNTEPIPIVCGEQTTYNYQAGTSAVTIVFKNDRVKESTVPLIPEVTFLLLGGIQSWRR